MTPAFAPPISFQTFLETLPDDGNRDELVNGERVQLMATRAHDDVADFIDDALRDEVKRLQLNYKSARFASMKTRRSDGLVQGCPPDVSVIDKAVWTADPKAYAALEEPMQLAVEVSSTNWRDDYLDKLAEYEALGMQECWVVDYLAVGATRYIGSPKTLTLSVYILENGEYPLQPFRGSDRVLSRTFAQLTITAADLFAATGL